MPRRNFRRIHRKLKSLKKSQITTPRNNKTVRLTQTKKAKFSLKDIEKKIKAQDEIREYALQSGNLEAYAYSNKLLFILLADLIARGTDESIKMANKYSNKTGVKLPKLNLSSKVPNPRNTVKQVQNSFTNPPATSIAPGWVW